MKNETKDVLVLLKEEEQDFEWYPTSENMVLKIVEKLNEEYYDNGQYRHSAMPISLLDIGAGDGRVLNLIEELSKPEEMNFHVTDKYAIEKSPILFGKLDTETVIVGTDFSEQTLIDKPVDVIFCNPPYSEFEKWTEKILKEGNCRHFFAILPSRWQENTAIRTAMKIREVFAEIIWQSDFFSGVERQARCRVDIIYFRMVDKDMSVKLNDPFDVWFDEYFMKDDPDEGKSRVSEYEREEAMKKHIENSLVKGKDMIPVLVELYRTEMNKMLENYRLICGMDGELLRTIGVTKTALKSALKQKIQGLKTLYWKELFKKADAITSRLTTETSEKMQRKFNERVNIDFTEANIYAVLCWVVKNANNYFDEQLLTLYRKLSDPENVKLYKSNSHFVKDSWRFCRSENFWEDHHHYSLDYRIVWGGHYAIPNGKDTWMHDYPANLHTNAHNNIYDLLVIAKNLGFDVENTRTSLYRNWQSGKAQDVLFTDPKTNSYEVLCEIKAFKNGNLHLKLNRKFLVALNVEAARLLKWVKSPKEASEQIKETTYAEAEQAFGTHIKLWRVPLLTA